MEEHSENKNDLNQVELLLEKKNIKQIQKLKTEELCKM